MVSRIILTTADFSANNIGRITELSELTKKVLAKQTQYSEMSEEAAALDTFLATLTEEGLIGGQSPLLKCLLIPGLAKTYQEAFFDLAKIDSNGYPTNIISQDELDAETKHYEFEQNDGKNVAIKAAIVGDQYYINTGLFDGISANTNLPSFSIAAYIFGSSILSSDQVTVNNPSNYFTSLAYNKFRVYWTNQSSNHFIETPVTSPGAGFFGSSYVAGDRTEVTVSVGTVGECVKGSAFTESSVKVQANSSNFRLGQKMNTETRTPRFGFFACGDYINPTKMAALKNAVETLMAALHVNQ